QRDMRNSLGIAQRQDCIQAVEGFVSPAADAIPHGFAFSLARLRRLQPDPTPSFAEGRFLKHDRSTDRVRSDRSPPPPLSRPPELAMPAFRHLEGVLEGKRMRCRNGCRD